MKKFVINALDDRDLEIIEVLRRLGLSRSVATLITYLANVKEANSKEIELGTGLREPDVSKGVRTLRSYNWIEEHGVKLEGKGRPMQFYVLKLSLDEIMGNLKKKNLHDSANMDISRN